MVSYWNPPRSLKQRGLRGRRWPGSSSSGCVHSLSHLWSVCLGNQSLSLLPAWRKGKKKALSGLATCKQITILSDLQVGVSFNPSYRFKVYLFTSLSVISKYHYISSVFPHLFSSLCLALGHFHIHLSANGEEVCVMSERRLHRCSDLETFLTLS